MMMRVLFTAVIALAVVAIVFRVPQIKSAVVGA